MREWSRDQIRWFSRGERLQVDWREHWRGSSWFLAMRVEEGIVVIA